MSTATTKRTRKQVERRVALYNADGNPKLLEMTIGKELFAYWLKIIDADYGIGFEIRKPLPETDTYHVHYDPSRRMSSCDCKGGTYNGHCKHQEAILALIRAGKLSVPEPKQQPSEVCELDNL
jgi:hypothetical protein